MPIFNVTAKNEANKTGRIQKRYHFLGLKKKIFSEAFLSQKQNLF